MISLNPEFIQQHCLEFDPPTARFVIENCVLRAIQVDGDTTAILFETARHDRPEWKPRTAKEIERDRLAFLGVQVPDAPPAAPAPPPPEAVVEAKEEEVPDIDEPEGEEKPL